MRGGGGAIALFGSAPDLHGIMNYDIWLNVFIGV